MKKIVALCMVSMMMSSLAMAEDFTFEPVEISAPKSTTTSGNVVTAQEEDAQVIKSSSSLGGAQTERFQNALLELDSVQVDMRDKLLEYKNQFAEIDAQYNKYKTERKNMKKLISDTEKKIKNIDKYKNNIRKDMI